MNYYKDFSKKELADMLDIIQKSIECRTEQDVAGVSASVKDLVSADYGVCGLGEVESGKLKNIVKIVNFDYPVEWLNMYAAEGLYAKDPIIKYNFEHYKTHLWSEAIETYQEAPYREFMNSASEFGLRYGIASGVCSKKGPKGSIFSFASSKEYFKNRQKKILDIVIPHVHCALERVCVGRAPSVSSLSEREKEVLKWMKEGKTNWEISMILNISERTIKFHVKNIEWKLNAVNKAHAVAIALDMGLVV